ncbi:MAG TPA: hypothetical protein VE869_00560 [Gemmatimonas sp.]|nr:hypothetical protein [Gemmatimonas sp.]
MTSFREYSVGAMSRRIVPGMLLALSAVAVRAGAQGSLSSQGFGYPVGGLSTRATGTAGAFGEFDVISPRNPAALGGLRSTLMSAQTEPEFRTLQLGDVRERTTAQRVPLLLVGFPAGRGFGVAFSATTFLDRSFTTVTQGSVVIDGKTLETRDRVDARGSIADLRAAVGWTINRIVRVGVAGHLFNGDNTVASLREFTDSASFGGVVDTSRAEFFGTALSVGADVRVARGFFATLSYRTGNSLESRIQDSVRSRASVPDRLGASLRYEGIPGSVFAVGIEQQKWTSMQALGSSAVQAHDVTNWNAGVETLGPRLLGNSTQLRAGYASGTLPFGVGNQTVRESRIAGGIGLPVAGQSAVIDLSVQRALRKLGGSAGRESAWLLGIGIQIRPRGL